MLNFRIIVWIGLFSILLSILPISLLAQSGALQNGGISSALGAYSFLRNDASARAAALGGAFVSIHDDPSAVFYNPAAVYSTVSPQISATFYKHVLDINSGVLVYASSLRALGVTSGNPFAQGSIAFSANYINYGQFERSDRNGASVGGGGTLTAGDIALAATYSNQLDSLWFYGVSVKYINTKLENITSGAIAFDAGMIYRISKSNVNIGVAVLHAGTELTNTAGRPARLPLDVRLGINHRLRGLPLLINASFARLADSTPTLPERLLNFQIGGEFYFGNAVRVRVGYDNQRRRELAADAQPRLTGFNGGVGLVLNNITVDYALSAIGIAGMVHRISLSLNFDGGSASPPTSGNEPPSTNLF